MKTVHLHFLITIVFCVFLWVIFRKHTPLIDIVLSPLEEVHDYNQKQSFSTFPFSKNTFIKQRDVCRSNTLHRDYNTDPIVIVASPNNTDQRYLVDLVVESNSVHLSNCDVNCIFTRNWSPSLYYSADAFFTYFHPYRTEPKCSYQMNAVYVMENWDTKDLGFNITIATDTNADIYASYFWYKMKIFTKSEPKTRTVMASAFISNCDYQVTSDRIQLIKELRKYGVTIDVYGKCESNVMEPFELQHLPRSKRKMMNMKKYKFNLCFENSINEGYISEKYWQALEVGTIPVYLGAPDIKFYEPAPNSILHVKDYSVKELAEKIIFLSNNDVEYNKMLDWKRNPSPKFLNVVDYMTSDIFCKLCRRVADSHQKDLPNGEILVRERNMFRYRKVILKKYTLSEFHEAIHVVFKGYVPTYATHRNGYNGKIVISRIYKSGLNYKEHLWGDSIDSDEKVKRLQGGSKLEVIFGDE
jgi:hypothetical protein